jgi:membrane protein implicated in regulation of membrane protease activity
MELKPGEIIAIVLALAIPVVVFAVVFIPGALGAVYAFALQPVWREAIFFGGAAIAFGVLAWRLYRRLRPPAKPAAGEHESPKHMPKI